MSSVLFTLKGRQATPFFYIKYRREATGVWFEYRKDNGTQVSQSPADSWVNQSVVDTVFQTISWLVSQSVCGSVYEKFIACSQSLYWAACYGMSQ